MSHFLVLLCSFVSLSVLSVFLFLLFFSLQRKPKKLSAEILTRIKFQLHYTHTHTTTQTNEIYVIQLFFPCTPFLRFVLYTICSFPCCFALVAWCRYLYFFPFIFLPPLFISFFDLCKLLLGHLQATLGLPPEKICHVPLGPCDRLSTTHSPFKRH